MEVRVNADGKGIAGKYRDKISEDFFQVPGSKKGSGLGLSSARRIIKAHGEKIWVESEQGNCSFIFTIANTGK